MPAARAVVPAAHLRHVGNFAWLLFHGAREYTGAYQGADGTRGRPILSGFQRQGLSSGASSVLGATLGEWLSEAEPRPPAPEATSLLTLTEAVRPAPGSTAADRIHPRVCLAQGNWDPWGP